jgi:flagellar hook protein FlgE
MALTSALLTGLSGLDVNQTQLNVVGNNIANANTVAFKSSRALFSSQFYITQQAGSPPSSDFGGQNPSQLGVGAQVASIQQNFTPGSIEATGQDTDLAIDGSGFFIAQGSDQQYTRDGSFVLNQSNQLVTTSGDFVQGFGVDTNGNIVTGSLQNVTIPLGSLTSAKATQNVNFEGNLNSDGAVATGASILNSEQLTIANGGGAQPAPDANTQLTDLASTTASSTNLFNVGDTLTVQGQRGGRDVSPLTFTVQAGSTLGDLDNFFQQGLAIDTSVPNPNPTGPQPGVTLDPNANGSSTAITITGDLGTDNALTLTGTSITDSTGTAPLTFADGTDANGNISDPNGESVFTSFVGYDSLGTPLTVNVTAVLQSKSDAGTVWQFYATSADDTDAQTFNPAAGTHPGSLIGNGTLSFDDTGKLIGSTGTTIQIDRNNTGASTPLTMNLDFSQMTSLTTQQSNLVMTQQDGSATGTLNGFSIGSNGVITGSFTNGLTQTLGQVAVANFNNPDGLVADGGNMYSAGANSGVPVITAPQQLGTGAIRSGALELSNVDISQEFINMIIASTGFSASSRVITTSDQLLTDLLNSSR